MASLDFGKQVKYAEENILHGNKEAALGRALLEPFASVNSGARKLMYAKELDQVFPLIDGEIAAVQTGYEIRYGEKSSSIKETDDDYRRSYCYNLCFDSCTCTGRRWNSEKSRKFI